MAGQFDRISKLALNRESVRLNVRVIRMWSVPAFNNPGQIGSLDMILMDEHGGKIQATVRKPLLYKFTPLLQEGAAYKMVYFNVVPNSGNYRATSHEFKMVFLHKTTVVKKDCDLIPQFGFSFIPFNEVYTYGDNHEYLIDVMGFLTAVQPERQYHRDGKMTTMVVMELTDSNGKLELALFGDYVDQLRNFLLDGANVQVIVVVQLARVKMFRGNTVLQNSMNATKLFFNPDIEEAVVFRNSIAEHGLNDIEPMTLVLDNSMEGLEVEFLKNYPKKNISQLEEMKEDGMFVVGGKIAQIMSDGPWFYLACNKCSRSVSLQETIYFCETCGTPALHVSPRYKVKVLVDDDSNTAVFVLFDRDMNLLVNKSCEELLTSKTEEKAENGYPVLLGSLVGKAMLFKVESRVESVRQFDGSYPVRKVCVNGGIMSMFELLGSDVTPSKLVFPAPFTKVSTEILDLEEPFSQTQTQSDIYYAPISLKEDGVVSSCKRTPLKRKLEPDFVACELGVTSCGTNAADAVKSGKEGQSVVELLAVKIEKN